MLGDSVSRGTHVKVAHLQFVDGFVVSFLSSSSIRLGSGFLGDFLRTAGSRPTSREDTLEPPSHAHTPTTYIFITDFVIAMLK